MQLRDMWLWNSGLRRPVVMWSTLATGVIVGVMYAFLGIEAMYFLFLGLIGPFIGLIYGVVGRRVEALRQSLADENGALEESLIVIGAIQSPGVVILTDQALKLVPIVGEPQSIALSELDSVRMTRLFNGKTLVLKKWIVLSAKPRLGFALTKSAAEEWFRQLTAAAGHVKTQA